jgi:hypothetical protein
MSTLNTYNDYLMHMIHVCGFVGKDNFTLFPAHSHPDVPADETVFMEFIAPNGQGLFFTPNGFTIPGQGFIPYKAIRCADWAFHVAGRESDYKEYLLVVFCDRPAISFHVGKRAAVSLIGFINCIRGVQQNMQPNL